MSSLNKVMILGRLGQDPEMRYTQNQTPVVNLSVATSEYRKDNVGEKNEFTEWHKIVVFSKQAENCQKYLSKGSQVFIEGKLQTRSWDKDGEKRYSTEIVAQNVQFVGSKSQAKGDAPGLDDFGL